MPTAAAQEVLAQPNYLTMQTGPDSHIVLEPAYLLNINHSCAPNTFWNTATMQFEALEEVAAGAELTFFYPSTEWDMETPFDCRCGAAACLGRIAGAKHLCDQQFARYRFNQHILDARARAQAM
ncbi:hypothetical protein HYH02_004265 [Chlamydomonas schloesseri]|uniref:Post-SET domain-containing protein n=1 Tax=Chlamydomonas schloesseri TaxID=2026947 RepID=A0A835WPI9_9CHLO|nr:hypothetical protein HYH02_004265 [Chlamydomonas schloesseri]|eukprot:KAG2450993.1 hypothetical protein HYH02_004265 [Chlamydomonas schloesseri]